MSKFDSVLKHLKSSNPRIIYKTLVDVRSRLSKSKNDVRDLLSKGLVPQLLVILGREKPTGGKSSLASVNVCLSLLGNLFMEYEGRKSITLHTAARDIPIICKYVLESSEEGIQNRCVRSLANLALDKSNMVVMVQTGAVARVAELLEKTKDEDCQQTYIRACRMFWPWQAARDALTENGAPLEIAKLLATSTNCQVQKTSLRTLAEMVKFEFSESQARQLLQAGVLDKLMTLAKSDCQDSKATESQALDVLLTLVQNDHLRHAIGSAGGISFFISFARERAEHPKFKPVLSALCLCAKDSVNRVKIREGGGLEIYLRSLETPSLSALHDRILSGLVCFIYDEASLRILLKDSLVPILISHLHRCAQVTCNLGLTLWARKSTLTTASETSGGIVSEDGEDVEMDPDLSSTAEELPDSISEWVMDTWSQKEGAADLDSSGEEDGRERSVAASSNSSWHLSEAAPEDTNVSSVGTEESSDVRDLPSSAEFTKNQLESSGAGSDANLEPAESGDDANPEQAGSSDDIDEMTGSVTTEVAEKCVLHSRDSSDCGDMDVVLEEEEAGDDATASPPRHQSLQFSIHSPTYQAAAEWNLEVYSSGARCKMDFKTPGSSSSPESPYSPLSHSTLYSPASCSSSVWSPGSSSSFLTCSPEHDASSRLVEDEGDWSPVASCPWNSEDEDGRTPVAESSVPLGPGDQLSKSGGTGSSDSKAVVETVSDCETLARKDLHGSADAEEMEKEDVRPGTSGAESETQPHSETSSENDSKSKIVIRITRFPSGTRSVEFKHPVCAEDTGEGMKEEKEDTTDANLAESSLAEETNLASTSTVGGPTTRKRLSTDFKPPLRSPRSKKIKSSVNSGSERVACETENTGSVAAESSMDSDRPELGDKEKEKRKATPVSRQEKFHQVSEMNITQLLSVLSQRDNPGDYLAKPLVVSGLLDYLVQAENPAMRCVRTLLRVFRDLHCLHKLLVMGAPLMVIDALLVARETGELIPAEECQEAFVMESQKSSDSKSHTWCRYRYQHWSHNCMHSSAKEASGSSSFHALYVALELLDELQVGCQTSFGKDVISKILLHGESSKQKLIAAISLLVLSWTPRMECHCLNDLPGLDIILDHLRTDHSPSSPWLRAIAQALGIMFRIPRRELDSESRENGAPPTFPQITFPARNKHGASSASSRHEDDGFATPSISSRNSIDFQNVPKSSDVESRDLVQENEQSGAERWPTCAYAECQPFFDVTFLCGEEGVGAQREVLGGASSMFSAMLQGHYMETRQSEIPLPNTSAAALLPLMHYLHGCGTECSVIQQIEWRNTSRTVNAQTGRRKPGRHDSGKEDSGKRDGGKERMVVSENSENTDNVSDVEPARHAQKTSVRITKSRRKIDRRDNSASSSRRTEDVEMPDGDSPSSSTPKVRFAGTKSKFSNRKARDVRMEESKCETFGTREPVNCEGEKAKLILDILALSDRFVLGDLTSYLKATVRDRFMTTNNLSAIFLWGMHYHSLELSEKAIETHLRYSPTVYDLCCGFQKLLDPPTSQEHFLSTLESLIKKPLDAPRD